MFKRWLKATVMGAKRIFWFRSKDSYICYSSFLVWLHLHWFWVMKNPAFSLIMASSLSSVLCVGLEQYSSSSSMWLVAAKSRYWVFGRGNILCGFFCWVTPCRISSSSCSPRLFCLSGPWSLRSLSLQQSVALFWWLCFSSCVLSTIAGSEKLGWQRWPGKVISQPEPRQVTVVQDWLWKACKCFSSNNSEQKERFTTEGVCLCNFAKTLLVESKVFMTVYSFFNNRICPKMEIIVLFLCVSAKDFFEDMSIVAGFIS